MKNSKKLDKETKNLIKAIVSVLVFFLVAIGVDAAGSQWYLWATWIACAFVWIGFVAGALTFGWILPFVGKIIKRRK